MRNERRRGRDRGREGKKERGREPNSALNLPRLVPSPGIGLDSTSAPHPPRGRFLPPSSFPGNASQGAHETRMQRPGSQPMCQPQFLHPHVGMIAPSPPEHLPRLPFRAKQKTHKFKYFINCEHKMSLTDKSLLPTRADYYF